MGNSRQVKNDHKDSEVEQLKSALKAEQERRQLLEMQLLSGSGSYNTTREAEKQFLASMSHEIRNPIHAVVGLVNLLYDTKLAPEQLEYVNNIKYSADVLMSLISGILDLSRIEAGNVELNEKVIDITELIKAVVQTYSFKSHDNEVEFDIKIDDRLSGLYAADPIIINQIFLNLLSNAVKFTEQGKIVIKAQLVEESSDQKIIQFIVSDTGIGIPEEEQSEIFETFNQGSLETKLKYGGTGLGLSIVKRLVSMYGGDISVMSEVGVGTSFTFDLHLKRLEQSKLAVSDEALLPDDFKLDQVLIVEDNKINQQYLTWLLEKWEIGYDIANHGEEALKLTGKKEYDLILMDIRMPVMDGYETTIRLRNDSRNRNRHTPIIALTASALVDERDKALAVGMNHHLPKPFSPDQLRSMLNKLGSNEIEPDQKKEFQFFEGLDTKYLDNFYGDDIERAGLMFNIFLKNIDKELKSLNDYFEHRKMEEFASLAHKIKPNFAMVGLPELTESMKAIEILGKNEDFSKLEVVLPDFLNIFKVKKEFIVVQLDYIKEYLGK